MDMHEEMRKAIQAQQEAAAMKIFAGTSVGAQEPSENFTLDKLRRLQVELRAKLGATPRFLASKLFPLESALVVENGVHRFYCAHPHFWRRAIEASAADLPHIADLSRPRMILGGMQVIDIDMNDDMTDAARKYSRAIWDELIEAVKVALTPVPIWANQ